MCVEKTLITAVLKPILPTEYYRLTFSKSWAELFDFLPGSHSLIVEILPTKNYTYSLVPDKSVSNSFLLKTNFAASLYSTNFTAGMKLSIEAALAKTISKHQYSLNQSLFSTNLNFSRLKCSEDKIWKEVKIIYFTGEKRIFK
jgi:hypothetical protein